MHVGDKVDNGGAGFVVEGGENLKQAGGGGCGIWKKTQPNGIVLLPADGQTEFSWIDRGVHADDQVRVTTDASGELIVEVPEPGEKPTFDRWKKGRVCAECGGNLGPTGQQACTEPVERRCN